MNLDLYHGYIIIQIFALVNTFMQIFVFILNVHKTKAIDLLKMYIGGGENQWIVLIF